MLGDAELPGTILRLPAVFGPGDRQHRFAWFVRRMSDRRPFVLLGDARARWRCTHGYVENVAAAVALAALHPAASGRAYNVGEFDTPTVAERVRALGAATGWTDDVVTISDARVPAHLREPVDYSVDLAMDTSRLRRELGYADQVATDERLRRTVAWERAHPTHAETAVPDYPAENAAEDAVVLPGGA